MYRFIFYFIYKYQLVDNKGKIGVSRYVGCVFVTLAILLHILFFYSIARYILYNHFNLSIAFSMGPTYALKWMVTALILSPICYFVWRHFNESRIQEITEYYSNQSRMYSFLNFMKFFAVYVIPLLISIYLVNHSIEL
jgi:hypothetical protein